MGKVGVEAEVVVRFRVKAPVVCNVEPVTKVSVALVAGAVTVTLLIVLLKVTGPLNVANASVKVSRAFSASVPPVNRTKFLPAVSVPIA